MRKATVDDVTEIALFMNGATEEVVRRFYRLQRCYLAGEGRSIACLAWVIPDKNGILVLDCCMDKRFCRKEDMVCLLQGIVADLPEKECADITIQINRQNAAFVRAALKKEFLSDQ